MNTMSPGMSTLPCTWLLAALIVAVVPAQARPIKSMGTWTETLKARDIDGDGVVDAYYDTDLDITWLADPQASGKLKWNFASAWVAQLNVKGVTGWQLPLFTDIGNDGCNYSDTGGTDCGYKPLPSSSDMAHMYYVTLGNKGAPDEGYGLVNTGPFAPFKPYVWWTRVEYIVPNGEVWSFQFQEGRQQRHKRKFEFYGWATHPGDVPHVKLPGQVD